MDDVVADLGRMMETHRLWAGVVVGAVTFAESLAFVGVLVPATALMLVVGGLVGAGILDPVTVLTGAVVGAVLGDAVSYGLGKALGPRVAYRKPMKRYRTAIARTRLFFRRFGFWAIFIGRFLGPLRSMVPLVAGMMAMRQGPFQAANVLSAIVWVPVMLAPGWLAAVGASELASWPVNDAAVVIAIGVVICAVLAMMVAGSVRPWMNPPRPVRIRERSF